VNEHRQALQNAVPLTALLGYVNFSEGRPDGRFQKQISDCYAGLGQHRVAAPWQALYDILREELADLHRGEGSAFRNVEQAAAVLELVFQHALPAYRQHHADLLAHQDDAGLFQPFFVARVFEAVLAQRGPWTETERIVRGALNQLNDYVGHRPIAILESRPRGEPYPHERVRPIPLYIKGAGIAWGRYQTLAQRALEILKGTDPGILQDAYFDPDLLDELAFDPRGYDFNHPVEKRPNYIFGEWDPHHVDNQGRYRRFVVRQVVLDAFLERANEPGALPADEVLHEAAAVLAGTILMAAGVSGAGPETHDSSTTLSSLVPRIARYREAFYSRLLPTLDPVHGERLRQEAALLHQPFAGARQHLNQYLARQRAWQLQQRHLAALFADIGCPDASRRQARQIPVASVRMLSEMQLRLALGRLHLERAEVGEAARLLPEIEDLLRRGIDCGAVVDPWNILGFQAQFPRFTALEDSVRDQRIDELIHIVGQLFELYAKVLSEGAATGALPADAGGFREMRRLAEWWDRFATIDVGDVPHVQGAEARASAEHVARTLDRWRERGTAAADLAFWREHLEHFNSPKAFALVIDGLLHKEDFRAAMALLMTWLGQVEQVPLEEGEHSFHMLALRWMLAVCGPADDKQNLTGGARIDLLIRFFDYLEANAEDYWNVPRLDVLGTGAIEAGSPPAADEDIYGAAYEDVTYKDSSDDNVEAEVLDFMPQKDFDLTAEADRLEKHVRFLWTVARLWNIAARHVRMAADQPTERAGADIASRIKQWWQQARRNHQELLGLLDTIHEHEIPKPTGSYESLVEFDRRRLLKERLLGTIIGTCLDTALAVGAFQATSGIKIEEAARPAWEASAIRLEQALWQGAAAEARALLPGFLQEFREEPLLFTPLAQGGHPRQVLRASLAQMILHGLALNLPRLGLMRETFVLVRTALAMEQAQPLSGPRVTSFDRLFHAACQAMVEAVLDAAAPSPLPQGKGDVSPTAGEKGEGVGEQIAALLEAMIEPFLALWLRHSKTLRISSLEGSADEETWDALAAFIQRYGRDLFQQRFMAVGNLRGIVHRGVGPYLDYLRENPDPLHPVRLIDELDTKIARAQAERLLEIILQAVIENYEEYRDYNATTTQSDYGDKLFQLFDFLRLKAGYERNAWQLRPLNLVHDILARRHGQAADFWRMQVEELTRELADEHVEELAELEKEHGIHLRTLADRIGERFVKPLQIDRLCALIEPAMDHARQFQEHTPLEEALLPFSAQPSGAGLDVPIWLRRLESEVQRVRTSRTDLARLADNLHPVPKRTLSMDDLRVEFQDWDKFAEEP
jgi:hypothetical protein